MPAKGTKAGDAVAKPQPFTVFLAKNGKVGVRIGSKRAYASVEECGISAQYVHVAATKDGLMISGEGCVRQYGSVIAITS